jgi:hypothetical protein
MYKLLTILLFFYSSYADAQQNFFVLKKGSKTIKSYRAGFDIAFQTKNQQWTTGKITKIQNDSFFIRPGIVHYYLMGTDTTYYPIISFALADVVILPKKGLKIDYINGQFQINRSAGHVHFYWIKSGWVFRVGSAGYALLNIVNGLIQNSLSFSWGTFGVAAGIFLFGEILHRTYKVTMRMGKKYHLEFINVTV